MPSLRPALLLLLVTAACDSNPVSPTLANGVGDPAVMISSHADGLVASLTGSAHLTAFPPPTPPGLALRNLTITAMLWEDGTVTGEWQVVAGATILHGEIDCMTVATDGRSARVSGVIDQAKFATFLPGTAFAMELFDNGDGSSGDPDVTTQLRAFRNEAPEVGRAFCETGAVPAGADLMPLPTEHGNFTIRVL